MERGNVLMPAKEAAAPILNLKDFARERGITRDVSPARVIGHSLHVSDTLTHLGRGRHAWV